MDQLSADSIRVLHVEDEADFAEVAGSLLEDEDERFEVETVTTASEGLDRLGSEDVDCIVSDYNLPGQNGIEFLEAVREEYSDLPFILYTNRGSEEVASRAISADVTDYLQKEGGTDQFAILANRIANAVSADRARQRATRQERINRLIRNISRQLVNAETVEAIERTVCEALTDSESYRFAWIGEPDPETGKITPRASAGDADTYLDEVTVRHDDTPRAEGPGGRAVETHEIQVAQNLQEDFHLRRWREVVDRYGFESVIVLPLTCDGRLHGILPIYADQPYAFDEAEQEVLAELADTICEAIRAAKTRHQFEVLFENAPVAIAYTEFEGSEPVIRDVNSTFEDVFDCEVETVVGEHIDDVVGDDRRSEAAEINERVLTGEQFELEVERETADGVRDFLLYSVPFWVGESGEQSYAMYLDVTDRKAYERQLERQNERLEEFVGIVSHDLRNPLTVAQTRLALARDRCEDDSLDEVGDALARMDDLIEDLLALARTGEPALDSEPVVLGDLLERCWRTVETADATLANETERTLRAYPSRLQQLLANLVRNSVEHGGEDVTVTVGDLDAGFYVEDDGPGIPEDEREAVFEAGYSSSSTGTGLGLGIARQVAEAHDWEMSVTEGDDGGTRFEITGVELEE